MSAGAGYNSHIRTIPTDAEHSVSYYVSGPGQVTPHPQPPLLLPPDENQGRKQDAHQYKPMVNYLHILPIFEKSKYWVFQGCCFWSKYLIHHITHSGHQ